jgi:hypothetical protein
MKLTWSKEPDERGLGRAVQAPRGRILKCDGKHIATVEPFTVGFHKYDGWYWYCGDDDELGLRHRNTCDEPLPTIEEAQRQCEIWIRARLGLPIPRRLTP